MTHDASGYKAYCFRCGFKRRKKHGVRSLADMIKHKKQLNAYMQQTGVLELPEDYTRDIPDFGRVWLLKGGVSTFLTSHYEIGWSESMNRVVIPVWDKGTLSAVQSRAVTPDHEPKYLNKKGSSNAIFWADVETRLETVTKELVLTEDILSTIRVGRLCACVSTLGTRISDATVTRLLKKFDRFVVWYDPDKAGVRGAIKVRKALQLQGGEVRTIKSDKDPKDYSNEEIIPLLKVPV